MALLKPSVVFALVFHLATGHVAYVGVPNHLHPVHGLYVKPSNDGSTGDLYVAATEENGVKSQWLSDQPVNFLPVAAHQHAQLPVAYTSTFTTTNLPQDETVITNQKRAVISSPPVQYTYALPAQDGKAIPYPYAIPSSTPLGTKEGTGCSDSPAAQAYAQYYQQYYTQMLAAIADALSNVKDSGEDGATSTSSTTSPQAAPVWPSYAYPVQYVMVDPATWAKTQASSTQPTTTPPTKPAAAESEESA